MFLHNSLSSNDLVRPGLFADIVADPLKFGIDLFYEMPAFAFRLGLSLLVFCAALLAWVAIVVVAFIVARVVLCKALIVCRAVYDLFIAKTANLRQHLCKCTSLFKRGSACAKSTELASKSTETSPVNKISTMIDSVGQHLSVPKGFDKLKTIFKRGQSGQHNASSSDDFHPTISEESIQHHSMSCHDDTSSMIVKPLKKVLSPRVSFGRSPKATL